MEQVRAVMEKSIAERWPIRRLERFGRSPTAGSRAQGARNAAGSDATPNNTTRHPSAKENAGPSLASAVEAVIERSEDRVVIDVARIKARALMPQEREALIDLLEDLLILARSA